MPFSAWWWAPMRRNAGGAPGGRSPYGLALPSRGLAWSGSGWEGGVMVTRRSDAKGGERTNQRYRRYRNVVVKPFAISLQRRLPCAFCCPSAPPAFCAR